jgi:hypothetical protein
MQVPLVAVALDLDARLPPFFTIEPLVFHLHAWIPDDGLGTVVTSAPRHTFAHFPADCRCGALGARDEGHCR